MRKKLFAILMSAMMMVTFMPAMAFADAPAGTTFDWAADYSSVKITLANGHSINAPATRTFGADGKITADIINMESSDVFWKDNAVDSADISGFVAATKDNTVGGGNFYFYDTTGAKLLSGSGALLTSISTKPQFDALFATPSTFYGICFVEPSYCTGYDPKDPDTARVAVANLYKTSVPGFGANQGWTLTLCDKKDTAYDADSFDAQTVSVTATLSRTGDASVKKIGCDVLNGYVVTDTVNIKASTPTVANVTEASFFVDEVAKDNVLARTYTYDGAEHTIVMKSLAGITVSYQQYNYTTGKYEAIEAPKFKDATSKDLFFRANVVDSLKGTGVVDFRVTVNPATVEFGFDANPTVIEGKEYKATDFISAYFDANEKVAAAEKKAVAADKDVLAAYFAEKYEATATVDKYNPSKVALALEKKVADDSEADIALAKEYKALLNNIKLALTTNTSDLTKPVKSTTLTIAAPAYNDVTTVDQTKTYKNKTGKLAKTWTFMCKGDTADYGALTYIKTSGNAKITVAKDGKVTVMKGLKKGTYTVKIKVKAPKASAVKTLKVIVKK